MDELRSWFNVKLKDLGWTGLDDVVDYVSGVEDQEESRVYLQSLLGGDPTTEEFISAFLSKLSEARRKPTACKAEESSSTPPPSRSKSTKRAEKKNRPRGVSSEQAKPEPVLDVSSAEDYMIRVREARRKQIIINCLSCGKIHMTVPFSGTCEFCEVRLLDSVVPTEDAIEQKDRLLEFDRNVAKRTTVLDDDNDFYDSEAMNWMSNDERNQLNKRMESKEQEAERSRREYAVVLDLSGRRVVAAGSASGQEASTETAVADDVTPQGPPRQPAGPLRMAPSASLSGASPQYIRSTLSSDMDSGVRLSRVSHRVQRDEQV
ncbi:hypothetical protein NDN08_004442 [Rhodosorus marinus]|uniref:Activating signal cointegrator 1 third domain-containing protein n=1 Tax=Rhodosorus marinus TaxID=101924 RepID=A0AAV8ULA5_9RHOD|nr:hypothetical protein NDN08_004442 [Rhodosorus marinus]